MAICLSLGSGRGSDQRSCSVDQSQAVTCWPKRVLFGARPLAYRRGLMQDKAPREGLQRRAATGLSGPLMLLAAWLPFYNVRLRKPRLAGSLPSAEFRHLEAILPIEVAGFFGQPVGVESERLMGKPHPSAIGLFGVLPLITTKPAPETPCIGDKGMNEVLFPG